MDVAQGVAVFVGVPAGVLLLLALPIFGPVWWRALRGSRPEPEVEVLGEAETESAPTGPSESAAAGSGETE